jgi:hypothetical protein
VKLTTYKKEPIISIGNNFNYLHDTRSKIKRNRRRAGDIPRSSSVLLFSISLGYSNHYAKVFPIVFMAIIVITSRIFVLFYPIITLSPDLLML